MLDDQKWDQWLELCDDGFHYAIKLTQPRDQSRHDVPSGARRSWRPWSRLPKHNTDHSPLTRHTTVYRPMDAEDTPRPPPRSAPFVVHQNMLDGVNSRIDGRRKPRLFLVGRYIDTFKL